MEGPEVGCLGSGARERAFSVLRVAVVCVVY